MKKEVYYLIYDESDFSIISKHKWFDRDFVKSLKAFKWVNTSHPKHKDVLKTINEVNNTNY